MLLLCYMTSTAKINQFMIRHTYTSYVTRNQTFAMDFRKRDFLCLLGQKALQAIQMALGLLNGKKECLRGPFCPSAQTKDPPPFQQNSLLEGLLFEDVLSWIIVHECLFPRKNICLFSIPTLQLKSQVSLNLPLLDFVIVCLNGTNVHYTSG